MKQIPGKIFLAEERGKIKSSHVYQFCTFNFGEFYHEFKLPLGRLKVFNEETLRPGQWLDYQVDHTGYVVILPITGTVQVTDGQGYTTQAEVEEVLLLSLLPGQLFRIANAYPEDEITYIQFWVEASQAKGPSLTQVLPFDFISLRNCLNSIIGKNDPGVGRAMLPFSVSLGLFSGRKEVIYSMNERNRAFFAFVMAGAFEIEGRLLHPKDGLALWNTESVEIEALSENALLLAIEYDIQGP